MNEGKRANRGGTGVVNLRPDTSELTDRRCKWALPVNPLSDEHPSPDSKRAAVVRLEQSCSANFEGAQSYNGIQMIMHANATVNMSTVKANARTEPNTQRLSTVALSRKVTKSA